VKILGEEDSGIIISVIREGGNEEGREKWAL